MVQMSILLTPSAPLGQQSVTLSTLERRAINLSNLLPSSAPAAASACRRHREPSPSWPARAALSASPPHVAAPRAAAGTGDWRRWRGDVMLRWGFETSEWRAV